MKIIDDIIASRDPSELLLVETFVIPDMQGPNAFWRQAARHLIRVTVHHVALSPDYTGTRDTDGLVNTVGLPTSEITTLLETIGLSNSTWSRMALELSSHPAMMIGSIRATALVAIERYQRE